MKSDIRVAYHAGSWYSDKPKSLAKELSGYLSDENISEKSQFLKSVIVPHAGYYYCGPTAGKAFINIRPENYSRVVVLGPSHHEYFQGCGVTPFSTFETPFGNVDVDTKTCAELLSNDFYFKLPQSVDVKEHSIEMEMPFLKYIFGEKEFSIVPIMVGFTNLEVNRKIGETLYKLYEDPKTLFVISSDFCHWGKNFAFTYYDNSYSTIWESTQNLDKQALDIIAEINPEKLDAYFKKTKNTICGRNPITIVLSIIESYKRNNTDKNVSFDTLGYAQSSKVTSMKESSVSYAAGANFIM